MEDIKEKQDKKVLKKFVYSIRLTMVEHQLLKKNEFIKKELDQLIKDYLKIYIE